MVRVEYHKRGLYLVLENVIVIHYLFCVFLFQNALGFARGPDVWQFPNETENGPFGVFLSVFNLCRRIEYMIVFDHTVRYSVAQQISFLLSDRHVCRNDFSFTSLFSQR